VTMSDERNDRLWDAVRGEYHAPPETPSGEMWDAIVPRLGGAEGESEVVDLTAARVRKAQKSSRWMGWSAAAAAVLVMGIGIGRMTAPVSPGEGVPVVASTAGSTLSFAARETLGRSETLLTMVRADVQAGRVDPAVATWTLVLLSETRLLLDSGIEDESVRELLEDMELVLVQLVGVMGGGDGLTDLQRSEIELALQGMSDRQVLPRIQAMMPQNPVLFGT